ncbi:MAG: hypothetical protein V7L11_14515 [Nostoc sp.]|uniref:hypothetical protein n=1 Tax=Nostoc sp. TaxID=1180 RepID=UPI002FF96A9F
MRSDCATFDFRKAHTRDFQSIKNSTHKGMENGEESPVPNAQCPIPQEGMEFPADFQ